MKCPYCGEALTKKKYCDNCREDVTLYKKAVSYSNVYYNLGLQQAKVRDLSNAISNLKKSIELNKYNYNARNLLGLCYFEIGEAVLALKEWVISKNLVPDNNELADYYVEKIQNNPTKLDNINQAIKKYNSALSSAKMDSEDLAIIQLKKVVNLNPRYIKAMHLLALLYIKTGERERAHRILVRALKIDVTNTTSLRYLAELGYKTDVGSPGQISFEPDKDTRVTHLTGYSEDRPNIMAFVNLILGVVIGIAVVGFLVVPAIKKEVREEYGKEVIASNDAASAKEAEAESLKTTNETLQKKIDKLTKELEGAKNTINTTDTTVKAVDYYDPLFSALNLYKAGNTEQCAIAMSKIDTSKFESEAAKKLYNDIVKEIYPEFIDKYYKEGRTLCNSGKYKEAITKLLPAYKMDPTNGDVMYFIGRSYQKSGDYKNARKYYMLLITDAANNDRVATAISRIKEIDKADPEGAQPIPERKKEETT